MPPAKSTRVTRIIRASRSRVYRALLDRGLCARWMHPPDMTCEVHELEPSEGGSLRVSLRYADPARAGKSGPGVDTIRGRFVRLVPDALVVKALRFELPGGALGDEMMITTTLADVEGGTALTWLHENLPPGVSAADNELGTRLTLDNLAAVVEGLGYLATPQAPLLSGHGFATTAREVVAGQDLRRKLAIVTGGYSGVGLETTRALAEAGATVVVPARTPAKARAALDGVPRVEVDELDLANPASIDAFAQRFLDRKRAVDMLIDNAGIMATPLTRDARGFESQFATNHLGHFQLTARLWPALARGARVVVVSSAAIRFSGVDFEDPHFERRPYDKWKAYGQSKTANVLFAVGLDRRAEAHGVRAFAVHPGRIPTDLQRHLSDGERVTTGPFKTPEQGAATTVWCATSPQLVGEGGVYCVDCDVAPIEANFKLEGLAQVLTGVLPWAVDPVLAEQLWSLSEDQTGVRFEP